MSYLQNLDEINDMINSQFEQEGQVDVEPVMTPGNTYHIIRIVIKNGAHSSGTVYVQDWSFENGTRTTLQIQEAKVYSKEQAEHIISNESGRSSMIRVNAQMDTIEVNYGPVAKADTEAPDQAWSLWMDALEFDVEDFENAMSNPSNFEPYRNEQLTEPNQMFIVTHYLRSQLKLVVSFPGHITEEDYRSLREGYKFGFNSVKVEYVGEGAASFSVFTFTL